MDVVEMVSESDLVRDRLHSKPRISDAVSRALRMTLILDLIFVVCHLPSRFRPAALLLLDFFPPLPVLPSSQHRRRRCLLQPELF